MEEIPGAGPALGCSGTVPEVCRGCGYRWGGREEGENHPFPFFGHRGGRRALVPSGLPRRPVLGRTSSSWVFLSSFTLNSSSSCRSFLRKSKRPWIFSWEQKERMWPALLSLLRCVPLSAGLALCRAGRGGRKTRDALAGKSLRLGSAHAGGLKDRQNPSPKKGTEDAGDGTCPVPIGSWHRQSSARL